MSGAGHAILTLTRVIVRFTYNRNQSSDLPVFFQPNNAATPAATAAKIPAPAATCLAETCGMASLGAAGADGAFGAAGRLGAAALALAGPAAGFVGPALLYAHGFS